MDKKSLYICLILFGISLMGGYGSYMLVDVLREEQNDIVDENNLVDQDNSTDDSFNMENDNNDVVDEGVPATEVYNKIVQYSGSYVNLFDYIVEFDNGEDYKDKLLTLTVDKIELDGKEYSFSLKNHPQHCGMNYDYMREGYNEFYINDKLVYSQYDQSCYLERVDYVIIINDKYIAITFEGQVKNHMMVYDKNINLVDTLEYVDLEVKDDEIIFSEYLDDSGCSLNHYIYDIVDGKAIKTFKNKTDNTECNR